MTEILKNLLFSSFLETDLIFFSLRKIIPTFDGGVYFTKMIAMYYNKPFIYSTISSIHNKVVDKKQRILIVNDTILPAIIRVKHNNKNIKIFVLSECKGCDYYTYNVSFIAYPWS